MRGRPRVFGFPLFGAKTKSKGKGFWVVHVSQGERIRGMCKIQKIPFYH
jgi:hypothetical protein